MLDLEVAHSSVEIALHEPAGGSPGRARPAPARPSLIGDRPCSERFPVIGPFDSIACRSGTAPPIRRAIPDTPAYPPVNRNLQASQPSQPQTIVPTRDLLAHGP